MSQDEPTDRNTTAKVNAINMAIGALAETDYAYIGNLDADVSFGESYFETLIERFESDGKLGVIGGRIFQMDTRGPARELKQIWKASPEPFSSFAESASIRSGDTNRSPVAWKTG